MKDYTRERTFNKIFGSLIGFAIGDAMGATTEFMTRDEIKSKYGQVKDIIGGGWLNLTPGEVTDDTQMMIAVADAYNASYLSQGTEHPLGFGEMCCRNFSIWYSSHPKDIGNACRRVISSCWGLSPDHWLDTAKQIDSEYPSLGNGGLMRCLYPALLGDESSAIYQGELTHASSQSSTAISLYTKILQRYLSSTETHAKRSVEKMDPEGKAHNSYVNAVYWSSMDSFESAILGAVNDGGDADTIAALTGGLAGARWGFNRIPKSWGLSLEENTYLELRRLAETATDILINKQEETL